MGVPFTEMMNCMFREWGGWRFIHLFIPRLWKGVEERVATEGKGFVRWKRLKSDLNVDKKKVPLKSGKFKLPERGSDSWHGILKKVGRRAWDLGQSGGITLRWKEGYLKDSQGDGRVAATWWEWEALVVFYPHTELLPMHEVTCPYGGSNTGSG